MEKKPEKEAEAELMGTSPEAPSAVGSFQEPRSPERLRAELAQTVWEESTLRVLGFQICGFQNGEGRHFYCLQLPSSSRFVTVLGNK